MFGIDDMAMATIGSSLLSSGGGLLGGLLGQSGAADTNAKQMAFNAQEAQKNREFQWQMGTTAYQRAMEDMKLAGLNPILAAGGISPSSGGGAQASVSGLQNPGAELGKGVASASRLGIEAIAAKQAMTQTQKDSSQTDLNKTTGSLTQELEKKAAQEKVTSAAQQKNLEETTRNTSADTLNKGIQSMILSHDATTAFQKSRLAQYEADQSQKYGPGTWGNLGGTIEKGLGRAVDFIRGGLNHDSPEIQQRIHNRRGVTVGATPGPGLVIDMPRR